MAEAGRGRRRRQARDDWRGTPAPGSVAPTPADACLSLAWTTLALW